MLQPILDLLCQNRVILASQSPRRKELLQLIGFKKIEIIPSTFEENLKPEDFSSFSEFVEETALQKLLEVDERLQKEKQKPPALLCSADTIVTLDGVVYGKPKNKDDAFNTLSKLSGKTNTVYTGVVIKLNGSIHKFTESADVTFGKLTKERIDEYINTGEPMDKAGGYGLQGYGSTIIEKINGDMYTVVGLPVFRLTQVLLDQLANKSSL